MLRHREIAEVPFESPLYPRPANYEMLSDEGQRAARVDACRQWLIPSDDPDVRARRLVASLDFFDRMYLWPSEESDPGFYDDSPLRTPEFHHRLLHEMANSKAMVSVMPRGSAKSTLLTKFMLLAMLTMPVCRILYVTSTHDNAKARGQAMKDQVYGNDLLLGDFGPEPEFGGRLRPKRSEAPSGSELFQLTNKSQVRCASVESRIRGVRPRFFIIDDPEYDASTEISAAKVVRLMDNVVFRLAYYATNRGSSQLFWFGTFVSKRHFLWKAMLVGPTGRATDSRFDNWNRLFVPAGYYDDDGKLHSMWPEMWPVDDAERKALGGHHGARTLLEMSKDNTLDFNSEMMGRPGDSGAAHFKLDEGTENRHSWVLVKPDLAADDAPYRSNAIVRWFDAGEKTFRDMAMRDLLASSRVFITCDYAYTHTATSDYKAACVMAHLPGPNILFVLDMWAGKRPLNVFIRNIFALAEKWRAPSVHVETYKQGVVLYQALVSAVQTAATEIVGDEKWLPRIMPMRLVAADKPSRISAALTFRFDHGLIKLPIEKAVRAPWSELMLQVQQFNPELPDGGLEHDDHLDTVAMHMGIVRGRTPRTLAPGPPSETTAIQKLMAGETKDEHGIPHVCRLDFEALPVDTLNQILFGLENAEQHADLPLI